MQISSMKYDKFILQKYE